MTNTGAPCTIPAFDGDTESADAFLAAALRNDGPLPPLSNPAVLVQRAVYHGAIAALLAHPDIATTLPVAVFDKIRAEAIAAAMWDLQHRQFLAPLLQKFESSDMPAVLLKGTALAYSLYRSPAERPRGDTDILIPPEDQMRAREILRESGFRPSTNSFAGVGADVVRQESWSIQAADGQAHSIDIHWGLMNTWALADLLSPADIVAGAEALPKLCPAARRIGNIQALLHACVHRAAHVQSPYFIDDEAHFGGDRLIWLQDINLLSQTFDSADWAMFLALVQATRVEDICLSALDSASKTLSTAIPADVLDVLRIAAQQESKANRHLLRHGPAQRALSNLMALPNLGAKLAYLRAVVFPPAAYMRARYPQRMRSPLFILYMRRFWGYLGKGRTRPS